MRNDQEPDPGYPHPDDPNRPRIAADSEPNLTFKEPTIPSIPRGFVDSATDALRSTTWDPLVHAADVALKYTEKGAYLFNKAVFPKSISDKLNTPTDHYEQKLNDWIVTNDAYHQYMEEDDRSTTGKVAGVVAGLGLTVGASLAGAGLRLGVSALAEATGEGSATAAAIAEDNAANKALLDAGFVGRLAKMNIYNTPFLIGGSTRVDHNGNISVDLSDLNKNLLIANAVGAGIEGAASGIRFMVTRRGVRRMENAFNHPIDEESPTDKETELPISTREKKVSPTKEEILSKLSPDEKVDLDNEATNNLKADDNILEHNLSMLPEHASEYENIINNPKHNSIADSKAIDAIFSRGLLLDEAAVDIKDPNVMFTVKKRIKQYKEYYKQKGLRQVYLNDQAQTHIKESPNIEELNRQDKIHFDAMPYMSTGALKQSSTFIKSESTGMRTFNYPAWYRVAKKRSDPEELKKLFKLADQGDKGAQYLRALYNQNLQSKVLKATGPLLDHIDHALENPVELGEIDSIMNDYHNNEGETAGAELQHNLEETRKELGEADLTKYTDEASPHYIKLLKNIKSGKLRTYINCILG